jgi:hypothetical protein
LALSNRPTIDSAGEKMMQQKKTLVIATLIVVAVAALTTCTSYALANQPVEHLNGGTGEAITYGEPTPGDAGARNKAR